ncbi:DnaJ-domain-containing protein [Pilatotrama ljubarskyi]|nr:DnaJ-domain-containing protein [Pilatotrama ljubarskyi]
MSATTSVTLNFYEILGIKKDATPEEVRKAYRRRALQTHPDRLPQDVSPADKKAAEEQFRLVNNAYEVLNNEESRKLYDKHGVWPPPEERPNYGRTSSREAHMSDPYSNDPFFNTPFGFGSGSRSRGGPFGFTDPFELFNSLFGDLHSAFENDPFFAGTSFSRSPFDDPFFRSPFDNDPFFRSTPFGGPMFGGSLFGGRSPFGALMGGPMFPQIEGGSSRMYSSRTEAVGRNGQWVSRSQMTRTVNGRTEVITKCIDADGNEHVTYSSPDGERYTVNGIEQPAHANRPIEGPRRSETAPPPRQAPQAIADAPAQPASYYVPQQQQQQQSYSIPISTGPHHQAHPQGPPANAYVDRAHSRASRHSSHRDEDPRSSRRSYTSPPAASPAERMYGGHDPSAAAETASNYSYAPNGSGSAYVSRDPRRDSVHSGHSHHSAGKTSHHGHGYRLSRHDSRDHRERERSVPVGGQEQTHGAGHSHAQRGWRGWLSTILHPFKHHHKHHHDNHEPKAMQVPVH